MTSNSLSSLRNQLLVNGYKILPNRGKIPALPGWNTPDYIARELTDGPKGTAAQKVARWGKRFPDALSTGLLICDGLVVIDIDVDDGKVVDSLLKGLPFALLMEAPTRYGGGQYKVALFCRLADGEEPFVRLASRRYDGHCVEIFGGKRLRSGNVSRQFGIYGPHSYNDDGSVARNYQWADTDGGIPDLAAIRAADLPMITVKELHGIIDGFEQLAAAAGWAPAAAPATDGRRTVYDIDEATRFDTDRGGRQIDYAALSDELAVYGDWNVRCRSTFMTGQHDGERADRCAVFFSPRHDCAAVYVYGDEEIHYPKQFAPVDPIEFAGQMAAVQPIGPDGDRPNDDAPMTDKVGWLLQTRGYCEQTDRVVELFKAGEDCQTRRIAFQFAFRSWHEAVIGPRGGRKLAYATSGWELNASRIILEGVRLRPDQPFPTYREDGALFKNTYRQPRHAGVGDIGVWLRLMEHLLPDQTERDWFCDWLAHKHRYPGIPGVAVIMVAADEHGPIYGAGRGMLRDVLARLFGTKYVRTVDFDIFTGKSAQGVYTDWAAYSLLVTVSEAKDTADGGKWAERRAVYERIKEIVDPRPVERLFTAKGLPAFVARSVASYLIFSNNFDAVQLPPDDRRVTVLRNGEVMPPAMAIELEAWMDQPGNIAELARWLEARKLSGFSAYVPLPTRTKTRMQELARSEVDEAFDKIQRTIGPNGMFTGEMLRRAVEMELEHVSEGQSAQIRRKIKNAAKRVKEYRLTPKQGRYWVMTWYAHDNVPTTEEEARTMVENSQKLINELDQVTGFSAQIIPIKR